MDMAMTNSMGVGVQMELLGTLAAVLLFASGLALFYWLLKYSSKSEPEFWEVTPGNSVPKYETVEYKISVVEPKAEEHVETKEQALVEQPPEEAASTYDAEQAAVVDQMLEDLEKV